MPHSLTVKHPGQRNAPTLREIRESWPPTVAVGMAADALGVSRTTLYEAIRRGQSPVKTMPVLGRILVITADLVRVLDGGSGLPGA